MRERLVPLGLLIGRAAKRANAAFERALNEEGATLPVWLTLMNLSRGGPMRQIDLAQRLGVTGATMSHHLEALAARGWVSRERPAGDRRIQMVKLSDEGHRVFLELRKVAQLHDGRLRHGLAEHEEQTLRQLLARVTLNLGE